MRKLNFAATLTLSIMSISGPSFATDQSHAIELCKKAQNCNTFSHGGGVSIWGTNSAGNYEIYCPAQGECECIACPTPQRTAGADAGVVIGTFQAIPRGPVIGGSLSGANDSSGSGVPTAGGWTPDIQWYPTNPGPVIIY